MQYMSDSVDTKKIMPTLLTAQMQRVTLQVHTVHCHRGGFVTTAINIPMCPLSQARWTLNLFANRAGAKP